MSTVGTPQATTVRYLIDAKGSTFTVRATATGMLSAFGHNPTIAIPDFQGDVRFASDALEYARLRLVIQAASLVVTDDISNKDRQEIERRMHNEVLETDGFPEIIYECSHDHPSPEDGRRVIFGLVKWRIDLARDHAPRARECPSEANR